MENKLTPEIIKKAKKAKCVEELVALARENDIEMTNEEANIHFTQLNQKSGELSDDELDNVAGGGCYRKDGSLMITAGYGCEHWVCGRCGETTIHMHEYYNEYGGTDSLYVEFKCKSCRYSKSWSTICTNPLNNCNNQ